VGSILRGGSAQGAFWLACLVLDLIPTLSLALAIYGNNLSNSKYQAVKVNSLGKWKTALQMVSMSLLLVARQPGLAGEINNNQSF
jgi:phosphatidylglycerophosphate synthase